ncbi:hypothetical protein BZA70DRAFT_284268 [Myxozyma melibiosi]|uniref:Uncharacterized protein n=1 Tax=Myxozyma melibiosi TaxID=54550 RepID=A0ABR1EZD9_9ASCO
MSLNRLARRQLAGAVLSLRRTAVAVNWSSRRPLSLSASQMRKSSGGGISVADLLNAMPEMSNLREKEPVRGSTLDEELLEEDEEEEELEEQEYDYEDRPYRQYSEYSEEDEEGFIVEDFALEDYYEEYDIEPPKTEAEALEKYMEVIDNAPSFLEKEASIESLPPGFTAPNTIMSEAELAGMLEGNQFEVKETRYDYYLDPHEERGDYSRWVNSAGNDNFMQSLALSSNKTIPPVLKEQMTAIIENVLKPKK